MAETIVKCLICHVQLPSSLATKQFDDRDEDSKISVNSFNQNSETGVSSLSSLSLIDRHLHTIFILKTIFQLPSTRLIKYLKNSPCIEKWITLCSNCEQLVSDCKSIYGDLLKIQERLQASRLDIIKLVKTSYSTDEDRFYGKFNEQTVSEDCRRFIMSRKKFT